MSYEEEWKEMYEWLERGREWLEKREEELSIKSDSWSLLECQRIHGKLDGIKTCMEYMERAKKLKEEV